MIFFTADVFLSVTFFMNLLCRLKIKCALFGNYSFLNSENVQQPILIIQFARVKIFRGYFFSYIMVNGLNCYLYQLVTILFDCRRGATAELYVLYKTYF